MDKLKPLLPYLLVLAVSIVVVAVLFQRAHWYGGVHTQRSEEQIVDRSRALLDSLGIPTGALSPRAQLHPNRGLIRQAQESFGLERSNALLRDSLEGYTWEVSWRRPKSLFSFSGSSQRPNETEAKELVDLLSGDINVEFNAKGDLLAFRRTIPDTAKLPNVSRDEARRLATEFLRRYSTTIVGTEDTLSSALPPEPDEPKRKGSVNIQNDKQTQQRHRVDYEFRWTAPPSVVNDRINISVGTAGNLIARFRVEREIPTQYKEDETAVVYTIAVILLYTGIIIAMVVMAFKRIRSYEIGFRGAVLVGSVSAVIMSVELYFTISEQMGWEILLPILLVPLFTGGALMILWAVAESVVRETWKDKYVTMDLLLKGHAFHSRVGASIVKGFAFASAAVAVSLFGTSLGSRWTHVWVSVNDDAVVRVFDIASPTLHVLSYAVFTTIFSYAFFMLFAISTLRRYIRSPLLVLASGAVIVGLLNSEHLRPLWVGIPVHALVGLVFVGALVYGDALAAFVAMYGFSVVKETAALFTAGHPVYDQAGITICIWLGGLFVLAVAAQFRKNEITDFDAIAPAFAKLISERERLQQELEIARHVQMSFLPKSNPTVATLDIASRCAPAMEVGGDYYDFIEIGKTKLGVAVGDVSGKGTQAAFFMTLTKGFLRALATSSESPAKILQSVNKLFYQNVERGVFISMVYGLFDTERKQVTIARAGHNPVIMRKSAANAVQTLNPMGLALGLDEGGTFERSIEEVVMPFQSGDLFVFYTDGFPEAMNKTAEEFGQDRLCETVERYSTKSAAEILEGVFADMRSFVGKAKQHDDMTIVVVKVA